MTNKELIDLARSVSASRELSPGASVGGVGAALITAEEKIYKGRCIDCSCGIGFCAEHSAIAAMLTDDYTRIEKIVAVNFDGCVMPPCGRCRELIGQINIENLKTMVLLGEDEEIELKELLPHFWLEKYL